MIDYSGLYAVFCFVLNASLFVVVGAFTFLLVVGLFALFCVYINNMIEQYFYRWW